MRRFAMMLMMAFAGGVGSVAAQTPGAATTAAPPSYPWYAEFTAAATLGHTGSSSLGVEGGYTFNDDWQAFVEVGQMKNVATADLDQRAQAIAGSFGGTATTVQRVVYFDVGLKYRTLPIGRTRPYVLLGIGTANVKPSANFFVNGTDVTGQLPALGVQLGSDLTGSLTKPFLTIGGGVDLSFKTRYLVSASYRYGRIFPKSGEIENDEGINTQRVQIAIGVRF